MSVDFSLLPSTAQQTPDDLLIGGCSMADIAAEFGTPAFVLDEQALRERARRYRDAFTSRHPNSTVCFATKAFPSVSILRVLAEEGLGCDVVGAGELMLALAAGMDPAKIVMHGNAKTDADIRAALDAGIGHIVIDGFDEIDRIERFASTPAPVLLRVSPGIESSTHSALATGGARSKFGIPVEQIPEALQRIAEVPLIKVKGLHAHIGSAITDLRQFQAAVAALADLAPPGATVFDFGGGLGVRYLVSDTAPEIEDYAQRLTETARALLGENFSLLVEPGRSIVAPAVVTLYRVVTIKRSSLTHVAVDGGMGDNLEASLYGQGFSPFIPGRWAGEPETVDLVGRHCESGDVLAGDATLIAPAVGDLVVVPVTGAYCFTMSNTYNGAPRIPVVFCRDGAARLAVRRETMAELMAREMELT